MLNKNNVLSLLVLASPLMASQPESIDKKMKSEKSWVAKHPVVAAVGVAAVLAAGTASVLHPDASTSAVIPVGQPCAYKVMQEAQGLVPLSCAPFQDKVLELELFQALEVQAKMKSDWMKELNNKLSSLGYKSKFNGSDTNSLSTAYPALRDRIPYVALAALPTPVVKLPAISQLFGVPVYMKDDSLTGGVDESGDPKYGGNKRRKACYIFGDALYWGAEKIALPGCVGSNYAVAMAAIARELGIEPICMLKDQPPSQVVQHNLLMHLALGSELHYSPNNDVRALNTLTVWMDHYKKDGRVPYVTPTGGSNVLGTLGFVDAAFELAHQIKAGAMPKPTHIYVATGSCATAAGLLLGCRAAGIDAQVVAVAVEPDEDPTFAQTIDRLFKETNEFLHEKDNSFPMLAYTDKDLRVDLNFTGPSYGIFTQEGVAAAETISRLEGVKLEGTYTGKGFACLLNDIKKNPKATVLFWNTYSGLDFKQVRGQDYKKLPRVFHDYFQDANLQPLARPDSSHDEMTGE
jgi:D-cysteine desulfhydrase